MTHHETEYQVQGLRSFTYDEDEGYKLDFWEEHRHIDAARLKDDWREPETAAEAFALMRTLSDMPGYYEQLRVVRITSLEEVLTFDEVSR